MSQSSQDARALRQCQTNLKSAKIAMRRLRSEQVDLEDKLEMLKRELAQNQQMLAENQLILNRMNKRPQKKRRVELESEEWRDFQRELEDLVKIQSSEDELTRGFENMAIDYGLEED